jgi:peptidoglycan/LPS O-acetylase OafA/YrhL
MFLDRTCSQCRTASFVFSQHLRCIRSFPQIADSVATVDQYSSLVYWNHLRRKLSQLVSMAEKPLMTSDLPSVPDSQDKWISHIQSLDFWVSVLNRAFLFTLSLLPKYMRRGGLRRNDKLRNTSYLDALRGIAALIVVNHHHQSNPSELPFLSLVTAGKSSVNVFFVISGYVLSYRPLKHMRSRESSPLLENLASSMFRRYTRLYLSSFVATFVALILARMGRLGYMHRYDSLYQQLWDWVSDCASFGNPFVGPRGYKLAGDGSYNSRYLDPLWTIPLEFRGSVVLYVFCLATCKMAAAYRMILCCGVIVMCYVWSSIYIALFLGGVLIADLNLSRSASAQHHASGQLPSIYTAAPIKSIKEHASWWLLFVLGLFLLSQPDNYSSTVVWPWPFLRTLVPAHLGQESDQLAQHFYLSIGAMVLVFALDNYPALQTPLRWDIFQYLGELSFGMYVMHVLLMWSFWYITVEPFRAAHLGGSWLACNGVYLVYFGVILWAGELFSRVDSRVVNFGKWLHGKAFEW